MAVPFVISQEFIAQVQLLGERLYFCGQLDYYESGEVGPECRMQSGPTVWRMCRCLGVFWMCACVCGWHVHNPSVLQYHSIPSSGRRGSTCGRNLPFAELYPSFFFHLSILRLPPPANYTSPKASSPPLRTVFSCINKHPNGAESMSDRMSIVQKCPKMLKI